MNSDNIKILHTEECPNSPYIRTKRVHYLEKGCQKSWDILDAHDSVAILIFDKTQQSLIVVKQLRIAVYAKENIPYTYELCAGLVDKQKSLREIASEEVLEECGYAISPDALEEVALFYSSVGFASTKQHLYYAEVDGTMKMNEGGGIDDEMIEVVSIPIQELQQFIFDSQYAKTSGLLFAFLWFLRKYPQ
ncbi:NUDIX hydrolase [Helicobacter monodelphidis]|uniref:NUDIX domain-containing protein n=1 Tax=Helicobacter sp. 15-1451 TaxID=2004995 RepID=UPI000DCB0152|nr:NUDIX domain-containing protein [Helicobacter sp. 15-1451]RAX57437.1 NUDIX hydrolase [Helicobacter sp. 15-1451]